MFFVASIALASILSLSNVAVNSAPVALRQAETVQQACSLPNGGGICSPIAIGGCTNTPGVQSLILNPDADCSAFPSPDCTFAPGQGALEEFSDTTQNLAGLGIQSVKCFDNVGTVDGFTAGSPQDITNEANDAVNGIIDRRDEFFPGDPAEGIPPFTSPNCTEAPAVVDPALAAEAAANGITIDGPVTCTF
ncbi:hypothetical protein DFH07DRAFT_962998 [Mycena maculata]|uniref:Uncharacterized protein n=1 Tax=Mycena maculata TaxID=230809 RepID=A0AAD7N5A5_9AGAR|nr:hypothetical protein DFH07DRAFT_962998 [Mycena maculata]